MSVGAGKHGAIASDHIGDPIRQHPHLGRLQALLKVQNVAAAGIAGGNIPEDPVQQEAILLLLEMFFMVLIKKLNYGLF